MNIADYLSELLVQHNEVSVPGLGYFELVRKNAWYSETENKFYPPFHQVRFLDHPKDNDVFTQYLADKKNISLTSSKYFTEKFAVELKEKAVSGHVVLADLGWFYTEHNELVFKANDKLEADQSFYGYAPVDIHRLDGKPKPVIVATSPLAIAPQEERPARAFPPLPPQMSAPAPLPVSAPAPVQPVIAPAPVQANTKEEYFEEETEKKKRFNVWLFLFVIVLVAVIAFFVVHQFFPAEFDKLKDMYNNIIDNKVAVVPVIHKVVKKKEATKLMAPKPVVVAQAIDTNKTIRYEIVVGDYLGLGYANEQIKRLKNQYHILSKCIIDAPGNRIKISAGTYYTIPKADSAAQALRNTGIKFQKTPYILPIKPEQ